MSVVPYWQRHEFGGDINELRVGVDEEVFMTLPRNRNEELRARLNLNPDL
ncbi:hypothetical protein HORIV_39190 [Vreelandella olivaria]|uniref:Uncharacterized protein n=1 Tax=Vreelandella olivaria TaxID=390919 RepID=A0ABM7GL98_9GAMM|nr:hypothetical protein HORIV_39190 [Halomonas olivaria]